MARVFQKQITKWNVRLCLKNSRSIHLFSTKTNKETFFIIIYLHSPLKTNKFTLFSYYFYLLCHSAKESKRICLFLKLILEHQVFLF
jgi:hypothetical protein